MRACQQEIFALVAIAVAEVQKKMHTLRTQFLKEKRKRSKGKSGAGLDDVLSKWKFFDELNFLHDCINTATMQTLTNMPDTLVSVYLLSFLQINTYTQQCVISHNFLQL